MSLELGEVASGGLVDSVGRGGGGGVGNGNVDLSLSVGDLLGDEVLPLSVSLSGNLKSKGAVLRFVVVGEGVGRLSVGDLVVSQEGEGGLEHTRKDLLDIGKIVELGSQGIADVNDQNLPISLSLINHGVSTQNLDLSDLSNLIVDRAGKIANIKRVIVT